MHFLPILALSFFLVGCAGDHAQQMELNLYRIGLVVAALITAVLAYKLFNSNRAPAHRQAFTDWLRAIPEPDALLVDLKQFATDAEWKASDELAALRESIKDDRPKKLDDAKKLQYDAALRALYQRWRQEPLPGGGFSLEKLMQIVVDNGIGLFLSLFAVAVFISLAYGLSNTTFFGSLSHVDQARGLITFLVAVCAVAVIMLTAIQIFWGGQSTAITFKDRYRAAKDLVTLVVGILGTILGFYFGSFNGERILSLSIDDPKSYSSVMVGNDVELKATARSGTPPFQYDVLLIDEAGKVTRRIDNARSDNGSIVAKVAGPETPGKHTVVVLMRDGKGLQTRESIELIVGPPAGGAAGAGGATDASKGAAKAKAGAGPAKPTDGEQLPERRPAEPAPEGGAVRNP
jgi:hypothetical protein